MICPNDSTQMTQYKKIGGGESTDDRYETWELKICPKCKRLVKEYYCATVVLEGELERIINEVEIDAGETYEQTR